MLPSTLETVSASVILDFSRLNIPPHTIAVYASWPPSPTGSRNTHYRAGATPYPDRTFTGWIRSVHPDAPPDILMLLLVPFSLSRPNRHPVLTAADKAATEQTTAAIVARASRHSSQSVHPKQIIPGIAKDAYVIHSPSSSLLIRLGLRSRRLAYAPLADPAVNLSTPPLQQFPVQRRTHRGVLSHPNRYPRAHRRRQCRHRAHDGGDRRPLQPR